MAYHVVCAAAKREGDGGKGEIKKIEGEGRENRERRDPRPQPKPNKAFRCTIDGGPPRADHTSSSHCDACYIQPGRPRRSASLRIITTVVLGLGLRTAESHPRARCGAPLATPPHPLLSNTHKPVKPFKTSCLRTRSRARKRV